MLAHAYNYTRNDATDFSPYYLMFGTKPHLPIDIIFGINTTELKCNTCNRYVENLKWRLEWVYKTAMQMRLSRKSKNEINDIMIEKSDVHS